MKYMLPKFLVILLLFNLEAYSQNSTCSGDVYDLIKPFEGTWQEFEVTESGEEFIGTLRVIRETGNCVLSQSFVSTDSTFTYRTLGYVDPGSNIWKETYVFNTGSYADYQWIVHNGDIVQRRVGGSRKIDYMHQLRFVDVSHSGYVVIVEHSKDGGKTWEEKERTNVRKISD